MIHDEQLAEFGGGTGILDPEGHHYDAMIGFAERRMDKAAFARLLERLTT